MSRSLAGRITLVVFGVHAVLLPALAVGLLRVVEQSHAEMFIEHARTFARVIADGFELGDALSSRERTLTLLDSAILNGEGVYAELLDHGESIRSSLGSPHIRFAPHQDFELGANDDNTYFIALPIDHEGHEAELRLGFDELPTHEQIDTARRRILWSLGVYFLLTMVFATLLGRWLTRPLVQLQQSSRRVASGDHSAHLDTTTQVSEIAALAADLERMRSELVDANLRLREEVREKEALETRRRSLEDQLRRRQRLETVGTLAGGVAHEFNNALVPIILYTESALDELAGHDRARIDLDNVLRSARRARDVVQKVLTFSRQLGTEKRERVALAPVIEEALRLFTALAPPNIAVETRVDSGVAPVLADFDLLIQLVMNLCTNAYQAMRESGGVLTLGLCTVQETGGGPEAPQQVTELYVSDTGHGMDASTVERIFEPFFTTREVGEGTGLGLAVAHGIAASFGAAISVESRPGAGTTFRVRFPSAPAATAAARESVA